jgi:glycosyltransferase involved in cell wall biosynthesis
MLNFHQIIAAAAQATGDKPLVAAPYPLPEGICHSFATAGLIGGYIIDERPNIHQLDPLVAGWWIDRSRGEWFIRRSAAKTMILLSGRPENEVGGRMLLEARLKGIQRILLVGENGSISKEISINAELLNLLDAAPVANPIHHLTYEGMLEDMYALIGDRLRLPPSAFARDRVLLLVGSLEAGGAERQAAYTAAGLARRYPGQIYLGRGRSGTPTLDFFQTAVTAAGVKTCEVREWTEEYSSPEILDIRNKLELRYRDLGALNLFHQIFHFALLIRDIRPALVHTWQEYSNIFGGIAADWVGVPRLVLGGRSVAPDNFQFSIFQPYMAPSYRVLLKRRDVTFLNNSEAGVADYARWLDVPKNRFRVLRNGFDFPNISPEARNETRGKFGIPVNAIVIGSLTRFGEEKRPELWMEMALAIHRTHPEVYFLVFGTGPLLEECRSFITANNLTRAVQLPGLTQDAWAALAAMDIFVLTSRMEGLPNVVIEAQGMGLPVICTNAGGMAEAFIEGETGFSSVQSATAEELAAAVRPLIDDPELRRRIGERAYRYAREHFGIERMVDETIEAYRSAVEHNNDFEWKPDQRDAASPADIRIGGIVRERGCCFRATLPRDTDTTTMRLFEDGEVLYPIEGDRNEIIQLGGGRYHISNNELFFSSSDESDPRFNGRSYRLRGEGREQWYDTVAIPNDSLIAEIGHCYIARLGLESGWARFELRENGKRLGPSGCLHDEIRSEGRGRYSVWRDCVYFSSSDNSDPRTNERSYVLLRSKKPGSFIESAGVPTSAPLEKVAQHLTRSAIPRNDFVPGRLVHVGGSLGPGGAERQIVYTLSGLAKYSFESIQLLCSYLTPTRAERHDFYVPALKQAGIPVRAIRRHVGPNDLEAMPSSLRDVAGRLPDSLASDIANLYWEFVEVRPEIVHTWLDGNNIRAGFAAALAGVPRIVLSGRNVNPTHFGLYEPCMDAFYKVMLGLPQVTMVNNSRAGRDDYAAWLGLRPERIAIIRNGCEFPRDPTTRRHEVRAALGITSDMVLIGTVCRLAEEKRPQLFVDTARFLLNQRPDLRFVFYGTGPMAEEIRRYIGFCSISEKIMLPGVTNDIWASLAAMDLFVLTSRMEGLPNVLIEAQGAGLPVVCTAVGGMPETYVEGETGFGVPSATTKDVAAAILRLVCDPHLRRNMSTKAMKFARQKFDLDRMIAQTMGLYRREPSFLADELSGRLQNRRTV